MEWLHLVMVYIMNKCNKYQPMRCMYFFSMHTGNIRGGIYIYILWINIMRCPGQLVCISTNPRSWNWVCHWPPDVATIGTQIGKQTQLNPRALLKWQTNHWATLGCWRGVFSHTHCQCAIGFELEGIGLQVRPFPLGSIRLVFFLQFFFGDRII